MIVEKGKADYSHTGSTPDRMNDPKYSSTANQPKDNKEKHSSPARAKQLIDPNGKRIDSKQASSRNSPTVMNS